MLFNNEVISVYSPYEDDQSLDLFDEPTIKYTFTATYKVELQPLSSVEKQTEHGTDYPSDYKIYTNVKHNIKAEDIILWNNEWYEVNGTIEVYNTILDHKKIFIRKARSNATYDIVEPLEGDDNG